MKAKRPDDTSSVIFDSLKDRQKQAKAYLLPELYAHSTIL
jgi:hypothetical protein